MKNNIKEIREQRGLNQGELARRIGTTAATVSRLEGGQRRLSQQYLEAICRVLNCEPSDLLGKPSSSLEPGSFLPVVGEVSADSWKVQVTGEDVPDETIPVTLPHKISKLSGSAYRVTDDHASGVVAKGGYVVTVPLEGMRKQPLDGEAVVVRSKEGRMERTVVVRATVDARGVFADLGEGEVELKVDHQIIGLVVATYIELV